jgi:hypothetical protein
MNSQPPPPYSESPVPVTLCNIEQPLASSSRSCDTTLTFHIGLHELRNPLVQVKHLKLHLYFLGALHDLRRRVESPNDTPWSPLISVLDGEQRWSWFVNLAVERRVLYVEEVSFVKFTHEGVERQISALGGMSFSPFEIQHAPAVRSQRYASS